MMQGVTSVYSEAGQKDKLFRVVAGETILQRSLIAQPRVVVEHPRAGRPLIPSPTAARHIRRAVCRPSFYLLSLVTLD